MLVVRNVDSKKLLCKSTTLKRCNAADSIQTLSRSRRIAERAQIFHSDWLDNIVWRIFGYFSSFCSDAIFTTIPTPVADVTPSHHAHNGDVQINDLPPCHRVRVPSGHLLILILLLLHVWVCAELCITCSVANTIKRELEPVYLHFKSPHREKADSLVFHIWICLTDRYERYFKSTRLQGDSIGRSRLRDANSCRIRPRSSLQSSPSHVHQGDGHPTAPIHLIGDAVRRSRWQF